MSAGPYRGVRVLDLTRVLAGPFCTLMLAELGATVIKVETPDGGDDARAIGPFLSGKSAYFTSLNRGKHSIALDLKQAGDRAIFEQLLSEADLLVENFRSGTMDRLGYGWEALQPKYPSLIYVAISGFGHTGPYRDRPAYDMVVQGMGGVMSLTGHPGGPPTRVGTSIGDLSAALFALSGVGAALYHRAQTGEAQKLDIAMLDCQVALLENAIARTVATGDAPGPLGARHPSITPFALFQTADRPIVIAAGNNGLYGALCGALAAPHLRNDPRFQTNDLRTEHHRALSQELERILAGHSAEHWLAVLEAAGVPAGPINDVKAVLADPQVAARNMIVTIADAQTGPLRAAGNPIKFSGFADPDGRPAAPILDGQGDAIRKQGFAGVGGNSGTHAKAQG